MAKYKYTGKEEQRHTIAGVDVVLLDGNEVDFPVGIERVSELVEAGILVPVIEKDKKSANPKNTDK